MPDPLLQWPDAWPAPLCDYLSRALRRNANIAPMRGLSQARLWKVCSEGRCMVVKRCESERERLFYQNVAPGLRSDGVAIPSLEWASITEGVSWLVLEHIPQALPRARWGADPGVLGVLRHLHQLSVGRPFALAHPFRPQWPDTLTARALQAYPAETAARLRPSLERVRAESQHLFLPQCWISGDTNPLNWGVRADGTTVLFDWERFGSGAPALDLAMTIPGLGSPALFESTSQIYLAPGEHAALVPSPPSLAADIARAKIWNIVEFFANNQENASAQSTLAWALSAFPKWLVATTKDAATV